MSQIDLLLLHPPSVYDFRQQAIMYGPISDLIPSSPVFEMYPLGFLTITNYLESNGLKVRVVNLALRMINDQNFDVTRFLEKLHPKAIGIDLHWMPHAHGSIEIAKIAKQVHPTVPIIFGGLSASYFHEELIDYPAVDYVLRGDSVEEPLYHLLQCLQQKQQPNDVPNLTWKLDGAVKINPYRYIPQNLDYVNIKPARMIKMALRYRDLQSVLPFNGWWQNPITAVFTAKGCAHACLTCGNSKSACTIISHRQQHLFRTPQNLIDNILDISRFSRGPIFLVGDLRQNGDEYAQEVLSLLGQTNIKNQMVFELFAMPPLSYLQAIDQAVKNWSLELSPESHDEAIRRLQDETTAFSNAQMEAVIAQALKLNCHRVDVFFMVGLARQSYASVMDSIAYCEQLFQQFDSRLSCFTSPMGPFLDPASRIFEAPERYGYRLFARTLEEHRQLLVQPSWQHMLNYQTDYMSREELVTATYDAAEKLNALKLSYNRISKKRGQAVAQRITEAKNLRARLEAIDRGEALNGDTLSALQGEINAYSISTVCDKRELFWRRHIINFKLMGILRALLSA